MKSFPNFPDYFPRFLGNETLRTFTLQGTERKGDGIRRCVLLTYLIPFLSRILRVLVFFCCDFHEHFFRKEVQQKYV